MPHFQQRAQQLRIPFGGRHPRARRTSLQGARVCRASSQAARMLVAYFVAGPLTDVQMAERLGLSDGRISARRNGLIDRKLVRYQDDTMGPFGSEVGRYVLTNYGREVAAELARAL